jgi:predicted Zn-dependent protease
MNELANKGLWRLVPLALGLLAMAFTITRGCQEGPFGRQQVVGLSPSEEKQLGAQAFQQVLQENAGAVVTNGPAAEVVERLGQRLAKAASNPVFLNAIYNRKQKSGPDFQWAFRVIRSKQVNAFCLPGGKVVVYTGIMSVAVTEKGLATVMGHEIGHALAHHGAERLAQQRLVS